MAKSFLRSGNLDDMLALGENGQPVFASALQLREALRLKQQQHIADCLAIPQPNEDGDRMDWYSPIPGKVTSWIGASHGERTRAIKQLEMCQATVAAIGQRALQAEKTGQKLFGALLSKAFQFPDQNHVYLVDGKPVITFWGFVDLDKKSRLDALDCLRATADEPKVEMTLAATPMPIKATVPVKVPSQAAPVLPVAKAPLKTDTAAVDAVKSVPNRWRRLRLWLWVPAAALAAVFALQLVGTKPAPVPAQPQQPTAKSLSKPVAVASKTVVPPVLKKSLAVADVHLALPVAKATVVAPVVASVAAEPVSLPVAVSKDALVLPPEAVKIGSTKFLNGRWRANLDIKDPVTGRPPVLKYQIKDGKGSARITYGDNISCRVDIHAGLMQSGNLVINSRTKARCSDGSRYQIPELVCKQGLTGAADCTGRYDADTLLPITMKRESK
ncbi:SrfA family protein [Yersinia ruckeri]|uniref:SrfA family protein n=1 Tax=Yersinia ruckeri TaxID=29486 RepID=UPI002238850D|nr:SrfA family protein [Yersinia ruckeri]MCW6568434.1 SrfA family protein [Yersinia ruckeri]